MTETTKNTMREIMTLAWSFVKKNGYSMSDALKCAWGNLKLRTRLTRGIVEFFFKKTDGTIRQAFGTLADNLLPETKGTGRRSADNVQVYFDTEKSEWRCFKKCNLIKMV